MFISLAQYQLNQDSDSLLTKPIGNDAVQEWRCKSQEILIQLKLVLTKVLMMSLYLIK